MWLRRCVSIPNEFKTFEELGLPAVVYNLMQLNKGLVLVTGATGSGKSTSLASMINYLKHARKQPYYYRGRPY